MKDFTRYQLYAYIHICSPAEQNLPFSSIWLHFSLQCQPFAICYLLKTKETKKNREFESLPLSHPKVGLLQLCFCCFFSLAPTTPHLKVGLPQIWFTQNKSFKMCVYLFVLVWGRCYELIIYKYYVHRYAYGIKYYKCKQMIKYSSYKYSTLPV